MRNKHTVNGAGRTNRDMVDDSIDRVAQEFEARDERHIELAVRELITKRRGMIERDWSVPSMDQRSSVKIFNAANSQRGLHSSGAGQFGCDCFRAVDRRDARRFDAAIMTVALRRFTSSFADGMFERRRGLLLRSSSARHVENLLLQDGAVQIINAIAKRNLRERQAHTHPISREMVNVIEVNATDSEIAKLLKSGSGLYVREHRRLRLESKWDETGETASFILQCAKLSQMIDPVFERLDMAVEHRASAAASHSVPGSMDIKPFLRRFLAATNLITHRGIENLGAAAGDRTETSLTQKLQSIANRHAKNPSREVPDFDGGESFDMQIGIERAKAAHESEIPIFLQSRMQAADHVYFSNAEAERFCHRVNDFFNCVFEGMSVSLPSREGAELAGENADIRVIYVAVVDVGGVVTILSLPHGAGHDPESVQVVRAIKIERVRIGNTFSRLDFFGDRSKFFRD